MKDNAVLLLRYLVQRDMEAYEVPEEIRKKGGGMKPTGYEVIIWWNVDDGRYVAEVPELSGCTADGATLTDVARAVEESIDAWIADCRARGREIPVPRGRLLYA